ncbi:hypothetical protein [Nocardioides convexus]|uniref:hypothetical protein n=1 Tax=Nocardioides convexus TaxID=2712224 RepID=UPI0024189B3B|nr:hypothetical protein [Nocardioides convexus]
MALALAGAFTGALAASRIPREAFEPIVLVALVLVGGYVVLRPRLGEGTEPALLRAPSPGRSDGRRLRDRPLRRRPRPRHRQASSSSRWSACSATTSCRPAPRPGWRTWRPTSVRCCCSSPAARCSGTSGC